MHSVFQVKLNTGDFRNNAIKLQQYTSLKKLPQAIEEVSYLLIVTLGIVLWDTKGYSHCLLQAAVFLLLSTTSSKESTFFFF